MVLQIMAHSSILIPGKEPDRGMRIECLKGGFDVKVRTFIDYRGFQFTRVKEKKECRCGLHITAGMVTIQEFLEVT